MKHRSWLVQVCYVSPYMGDRGGITGYTPLAWHLVQNSTACPCTCITLQE